MASRKPLDYATDDILANLDKLDASPQLAQQLEHALDLVASQEGLAMPALEDFQTAAHTAGRILGRGAVVSFHLLAKASALSYAALSKSVTEMRVHLDKSGVKDLQRTESLFSQTGGEGQGTFNDRPLSTALEVHGQLPEDISQLVAAIISASEHVVQKVLPVYSKVLADVIAKIPTKDHVTAAELEKHLPGILQTLEQAAPIETAIGGDLLQFTWPGGHGLMRRHKPDTLEAPSDADSGIKALVERLNKGSWDIDLHSTNNAKASSSLVPTLQRHQVQALFGSIVKLVHVNQALLDLLDGKSPSVLNPKQSAKQVVDAMKVGVHLSLKDPQAKLSVTAAARADLVIEMFDKYRYLDPRDVAQTLFRRNLDTIRVLLDYIRSSLKQYQ